MMRYRKSRTISPAGLFFLLAAIQLVFAAVYLMKTDGNALNAIMPVQGADQFMDFFNHITYVRDPENVYFASPHACFPPFVYFMYSLFSRILPQDATVIYSAESTSTHALLLYVVYCAVLAVLFFYSVCRLLKNRTMEFSLAVVLAVMLSEVYIFSVTERGNSVLIVCILLLLALEMRERQDKWHREAALLFIAAAAGIKIYPAVFGLLYLYEKRWKEAGRLLVYGVLFFFAPFICFGGMTGMKQFFLNQGFVQSQDVQRFGSVKMTWERAEALLAGHLDIKTDLSWAGILLTVLFLLVFAAGSYYCTEQYKRILLLCGIMVVVPFWSGGYTRIYMCLPLVLFFRDVKSGSEGTGAYIYAGLFAMIFSLLIYDHPLSGRLFGTSISVVKSMLAVYAMCVLAAAEAAARQWPGLKKLPGLGRKY